MNTHLSTFILTRCHVELPLARPFSRTHTLEPGMSLEDPRYAIDDPAELRVVLVEYYDGGLAIAPSQIAKKLVDCLGQFLLALPYLALSYECGSGLILDANISLAASSERLAGSITLIVAIQMREENVSKLFFVVNGIGLRSCLESPTFVPNYRQDVRIFFFRNPRLRFVSGLGGRWQRTDKLPGNLHGRERWHPLFALQGYAQDVL